MTDPSPPDLGLSLSEPERKLVRTLLRSGTPSPIPEEVLARESGLPSDVVRGALERLRAKRLAILDERHETFHRLSPRGREVHQRGLPERRLLEFLKEGPRTLESITASGILTPEEVSVAVGQLRRGGRIRVGPLLEAVPPVPERLPEEEELDALAAGRSPPEDATLRLLRKRGLVVEEHRSLRSWKLSPEGSQVSVAADEAPLVGPLTAALLSGGNWEKVSFRPYDVRAEVPRVVGTRTHLYLSWLREFEEILLGLGFEEYRTPLVETEFYNSDVLFMPQEHPARSIHDLLSLEGVEGSLPPRRLLQAVRAVHEGRPLPRQKVPLSRGWQAPYRDEVAKRVILRSHTTSTSVRYLETHPKPPFRMYCIDTVFRRDAVDASHHFQFDQCEGVFGKRGVTLRHLLGLLTQMAHALGIREIRFRPSYFPFTEPSVEGYVRHPTLGWIEVLPGGMFRPEVLRPLGIKVPVAAWGIGITRLAMISLGVSDIRELYTTNLDLLAHARI